MIYTIQNERTDWCSAHKLHRLCVTMICVNSYVVDAVPFAACQTWPPSLQAPLECIVQLILLYLQQDIAICNTEYR